MSDKLKNITDYLRKSKDYKYTDLLIKDLRRNKISIFSDDLLSDILKIAIDNNSDYNYVLKMASNLYKIMLFDEKDILNRNLFLEYLSLMVSKNVNPNLIYDLYDVYGLCNIYSLFNDKKLLLGLYKSLNNIDKLDKINSYLLKVRKYYVDETAFYAQALNIVDILNNNENEVEIDRLIKKEIEKDKQLAGIYDIDLEKVMNLIDKTLYKEEIINDKLNKVTTLLNNYFNNDDKNDNVELLHEIREYIEKLEKQITLLENGTKDKESIKLLEEKIDTLIDKINKKESNNSSKTEIKEINNKLENNHLEQFIEYTLFKIRGYLDKNIAEIKLENPDIKYKVREKIKENITVDKSKEFKEGISAYSISGKFDYLCKYYWALYNDNEKLFERLINNLDNNENIKFKYLNKEISEKFDLSTYVDLIFNNELMLFAFIEYDKIDILSAILKLNPSFKLESDYIIKNLDQIIDIFGIDIIAKNSILLIHSLENTDKEDYQLLKNAYDINNNICISNERILRDNNIFSLEELANLTELQQQKLYSLLSDYGYIIYPKSINELYKNQIRKIVFSGKTVYCYQYKKFLDDLLFKNIDIDTYLALDYEEQESIYRNNKRKCKKIIKQFNDKKEKVSS